MSLKFISFASGSSGNCSLVFTENTAILIDAGITLRRLQDELKKLNLTINDVGGIVVTHEHSDHVKNLCLFSKYIPVYCHPYTHIEIFNKYNDVDKLANVEDYMEGFTIGDIDVKPFETPHDANYPLGYSFTSQGKKFSLATDMGVIEDNVFEAIKDSDAILLESNHDVKMLKSGPYPQWLKNRVIGKRGHLSNTDCARFACMIKKENPNLKELILGHISKENNIPMLALETVKSALSKEGLLGDTIISVALQGESTRIYNV